MTLSNYIDLDKQIYVSYYSDCNADFHFVMNSETSGSFKYLYDSVKLGNKHLVHFWIKNYVTNYMKKKITTDDIVIPKDEEVIRKLCYSSIVSVYLSRSV